MKQTNKQTVIAVLKVGGFLTRVVRRNGAVFVTLSDNMVTKSQFGPSEVSIPTQQVRSRSFHVTWVSNLCRTPK